MKNPALLFLFVLYSMASSATECTLSGHMRFGTGEEPLASYVVGLSIFSEGIFLEDTTDENGAFFFSFEHEFDGPAPIFGVVTATDFCTGEVLAATAAFLESFPDTEGVALVACSDVDPPNPPLNCQAYFHFEQMESEPYLLQFYDISSTAAPVQSWSWDFGDGSTSTQADPLHEYSAPGSYEVSLAVVADTCESIYTSHVLVRENYPCFCDWAPDPACVTLPGGQVLTFRNGCEAECAGYTPDQHETCDGTGGVVCYPDFAAVPTGEPGQVRFTDRSVAVGAEITEWFWDFGDGASSTEQNPVHNFSEAGMLDVGLRIVTNGGCAGALYQPVFVNVVSSTEEAAEEFATIRAFPNPASSQLTLSLNLVRSGRYNVVLHNAAGQALRQLSYGLPAGEHQLEIGLEDIPSGLLFLQVQGENTVKTLRIIRK